MRTHRTLLVLNWCICFQDHDDVAYVEWDGLKKLLSRKELIQLIRNVRSGKDYISGLDNPKVTQVVGV